jgi:hypothetical protein
MLDDKGSSIHIPHDEGKMPVPKSYVKETSLLAFLKVLNFS